MSEVAAIENATVESGVTIGDDAVVADGNQLQ